MKVGFIGLGKLGLPCAEVMATKHEVRGYDVTLRTSETVQVVDTLKEAVEDRDFVFIAVPTPHDPQYGGDKPTHHLPNRDFDYSYVENVLKEINDVANEGQRVVLISTVLPGTTRARFVQLTPKVKLIYNPYLIAMGTVKKDMVDPEMIIIGTETGDPKEDAVMELLDLYREICNITRVELGTWDEAEAIKIFYNTFISAKLSLVNMIQDVAERNGNMSVDVVTGALARSTRRIMGPQYMVAGMGDAGACHPRDNIALRYLAERLELGYDLFDSIMLSREVQAKNLAKTLLESGKNVCIVGKAYKPGIDLIDGSYSLLVGHYVEELGGTVSYYDENTGDLDFPKESPPPVFLIGYWDTWTHLLQFPAGSTIVDPWRKFPEVYGLDVVHYGDTRHK